MTAGAIHHPVGDPPAITSKAPAPRPASLDGRTVYLVDCRFDDSGALLAEVQRWFAAHLPSVATKLVHLASTYSHDDPALWEQIRAQRGAAILGVGHCSTCAPAVATHAVTLETRYGVPTVTLHTDAFITVVRSVLRSAGLPQAPVAFVPQPVMGRSAAQLAAYVNGNERISGRPLMRVVLEALTQGLAAQATPSAGAGPAALPEPTPRFVDAAAGSVPGAAGGAAGAVTEDDWQALFLERRWTDQLPIVLPTEARVAAMLRGTSRRPDELVGRMQPTLNRGLWSYTVERVAVNAVMAGARPEYLPVILALAASGVSARGSTSSSAAVMAVVNGPIRRQIGMNAGIGALGPMNHANATIGRAYGLLSQNLQGGSVPGDTFMGSLGSGYTYGNLTFAENEERSPWEPLHVQRGYAAEASVLSLFNGCRSTTFGLGLRATHWQAHVRDMLRGTDAITAPVLLLDPIVARQFVERGGFVRKADLIRWLHDNATMPAGRFWDLQLVQNYIAPRATFGDEPYASRLKAAPEALIPMFVEDDIQVIVVGGETNGYWQMMGAKHRASVLIDDWR